MGFFSDVPFSLIGIIVGIGGLVMTFMKDTSRVLVTADLETIKARFAGRMHGNLPAPVATMLEQKHGCFDMERHDIHVISENMNVDDVCRKIAAINT